MDRLSKESTLEQRAYKFYFDAQAQTSGEIVKSMAEFAAHETVELRQKCDEYLAAAYRLEETIRLLRTDTDPKPTEQLLGRALPRSAPEGVERARQSAIRLTFECGCFVTIWAENDRVKSCLACCQTHEAPSQSLRNILTKCPMLLIREGTLS
jgi:hypothetical protein